jgi:hypothetical protein
MARDVRFWPLADSPLGHRPTRFAADFAFVVAHEITIRAYALKLVRGSNAEDFLSTEASWTALAGGVSVKCPPLGVKLTGRAINDRQSVTTELIDPVRQQQSA